MKLNELIECVDCGEVDAPTMHGACATCGSHAVAWLVGEQPFLLSRDFQREEPHGMSGIDREFLREMGVEA